MLLEWSCVIQETNDSPVLAKLAGETVQMVVVAFGFHHKLVAGYGFLADRTVTFLAE